MCSSRSARRIVLVHLPNIPWNLASPGNLMIYVLHLRTIEERSPHHATFSWRHTVTCFRSQFRRPAVSQWVRWVPKPATVRYALNIHLILRKRLETLRRHVDCRIGYLLRNFWWKFLTGSGQVTELWRHKRDTSRPDSHRIASYQTFKGDIGHIEAEFDYVAS